MTLLKRLDLWQKISVDGVSQPTFIGSILSIFAISMTIILLLREIYDLLTPKIKHDTIIYQDPNQNNKIKVHLEIQFPRIPCHLLSLDQEDQMGNHKTNIADTIQKSKGNLFAINSNINYPAYSFASAVVKRKRGTVLSEDEVTLESTIEAIKKKESCMLSGYVPINKVPGDIHISFHDYSDNFYTIKENYPEILNSISLSHRINGLFFGEEDVDFDILERFGLDHNGFATIHNGPGYLMDNTSNNYDYYIKLIPYLLIDEMRGNQYLLYQYSVSQKSRKIPIDSDEMPIIMLSYDMSPLTMRVTRSSKSWTHSLTHISAIIGGMFVIFSLLNKILLTFCDFSKKRRD